MLCSKLLHISLSCPSQKERPQTKWENQLEKTLPCLCDKLSLCIVANTMNP